jgi:hypothetical protein
LLRLWKDGNIYEEKVLAGWEAMLKADKANYYSFNLRDGFFQPSSDKDKKLLEKLKQIVVPELKTYFKKLLENPQKLAIECKLQGLPYSEKEDPERMVERLVAVQEFKIRKHLKERLRQEELYLGEDLSQNKDYLVTR